MNGRKDGGIQDGTGLLLIPKSILSLSQVLMETIFEGNEDHKPIIDLKGGTKRNSIEMMDAGREVFTEPEFILSGMGESILLSRGLILPRALLSLKELVWLTSGFVIDPMIIPNHNMKQTVKDNFSFKEIQRNGVKRARFDDEFLKRIGKKVPDNEFHRKNDA